MAGYVNGLCTLAARTTRQCWSYSQADEKVFIWRVDELEAQAATEATAALGARSSLTGHGHGKGR